MAKFEEPTLREEPRFSVTKLAEYMVTNPARRTTLIREQIRPLAVRVVNYNDARRVLARFCSDPTRTPRQLQDSAGLLRDRAADPAMDDFRRDCLKGSARAIEAFASVAYDVRVRGVIAMEGPRQGADVPISGVRVVIAPDICFLEKGSEARIGAAKLHYARTEPLNNVALQYVASLIYYYLKTLGESPRARTCLAIDVFTGQIEAAPKTLATHIRYVKSACQEIADRWPALFAAAQRKQQESRGEE
jgi:hypothetical protein